jgi:response regulator of citrate/malate metabolism
MGRKSVPFVDESSLLKLRLRDALDDHAELSLMDEDGADGDASDIMASSEPGAPAGVTVEDLYRRNRNRARLVGLLHTHRAYQGAQIIVVASGNQVGVCEDLYEDDAMSWFVKPIEQDRLVQAALQLVH